MNRQSFNRYLLTKLPIAWIAGVRLRHLDDSVCQVEVKYGWRNKNPFNSMFWAVEGMAAELSTGTLCVTKIRQAKRKVMLLVVNLEASFTKRAIGNIVFQCNQGHDIEAALERAINTREPQMLKVRSIGIDEQGEQVAEFFFVWRFKVGN